MGARCCVFYFSRFHTLSVQHPYSPRFCRLCFWRPVAHCQIAARRSPRSAPVARSPLSREWCLRHGCAEMSHTFALQGAGDPGAAAPRGACEVELGDTLLDETHVRETFAEIEFAGGPPPYRATLAAGQWLVFAVFFLPTIRQMVVSLQCARVPLPCLVLIQRSVFFVHLFLFTSLLSGRPASQHCPLHSPPSRGRH